MNWAVDLERNLGMSYIQKCGSFSIKNSMPYHARYGNVEALEKLTTRVAWIRHPIQRIRSAFFFLRNMDNSVPRNYENFIDFTFLNTEWDDHWNMQSDVLTHESKFVPTVVHRFEDINVIWPQYYSFPLDHIHKSEPALVTDYRMNELLKKYNADISLWESI